jgi:hypothetical protein
MDGTDDVKEVTIEMGDISNHSNHKISNDKTDLPPTPMTPSPTPQMKYEWTLTEFDMLRSTYKRLSINSARLLETAKSCKNKESVMQYIIVMLGLASSFLSALPGINETVRAYMTSIFTMLTALLGGWMSKKAYGQKAGKYYSAYQEYKDLLTIIDNIMVTLKSDRDYESFNYLISKIESKYEIFLPINVIDEEKIDKDCMHKFELLGKRLEDMKTQKLREKYKIFIDRKSYMYMHESKLNLYRQYVFIEKFEKKSGKVFGCYEYEDWCRIHYPDKFKKFTEIYDRYVKAQIERFLLANGDYDSKRIEMEISTRRMMSLPEREFTRTVHEKFLAFQEQIRSQEYTERDREQRSDENYSLDLNN